MALAQSMPTFGGTEMLQIADAVSREKGISKESVLHAMEQAIQSAGRKKYGNEHDIRAEMDHKTGEVSLFRVLTVSEEVEDPAKQVTLEVARIKNTDVQIGDEIRDLLPPIDFGRIAAQTAKQVIIQKVRDAERDKQYEEFKDRTGEIVSAIVKRVDYGNVVLDLGRTEAVMKKDECIPRENFRPGDRVRAYLVDVRRERTGPQIFLSRSHPQFLARLFSQEVPEIYDNIIEIKGVARDPGSRAKICVASRDSSVDPVGSCVGIRGGRVQAVTTELQGEKIDIIQWSPDPAALVVNSLSPAEVVKVVIDEEKHRLEVVVPDEQLSQAIGRRGQNVKLASQVIGWNIDVMTESEESTKRADEFKNVSEAFIQAMDIEDVIAHLLVAEGFRKVTEIASASVSELASIEGFDENIAEALIGRANLYLEATQNELSDSIKRLGVDTKIAEFPNITEEMLVKLGEAGVKSVDDFADLASDELLEILGHGAISNRKADEAIMAARAHWFSDDAEKIDSREG